MRILVITQYFWPENFKINDVCQGLVERGHDVTVLTGKPNYPFGTFYSGYGFFKRSTETWNGINVVRSPLIPRGTGTGFRLFVNYISFVFFATVRLLFLKGKFDRIFVYEPSPVTVGIPALFAKRKYKAPIFFWVNDLWPESLTAAGGVNNKTVLRLIDNLARAIYRASSIVLVQSPSFTSYLLKQDVPEEKIRYFPQPTEHFYRVMERDVSYKNYFPEGFNIVYGGNIGAAQGLNTMLKAAEKVHENFPHVNWIIVGDGRMKEELSRYIENNGLQKFVRLAGHHPNESMPFFFAWADALFISLKKSRIFSLTIPTKLQSYLACGKPIIGSIDGIAGKIVDEAACGVIAPAENIGELVAAVERMVQTDEKNMNRMAVNARMYFEKEFEREMLLDRLEEILK